MSGSGGRTVLTGGTIALAAALPAELAAIKRLGAFRKARSENTFYLRGDVRGADAALFVSGVGRARAYDTAKAACRALPLSAYISVGFSAALTEGLRPGDVVVGVGTSLPGAGKGAGYRSDEGLVRLAEEALRDGDGFGLGGLLTADKVLVTPGEKRGVAGPGGAVALDMESAGAAQAAVEEGVPFLAVRAISDALDEGLPVDFNAFMKGGSMDWPSLVLHIITHPRTIPGLMRLGRNSRLASRNLARAVDRLLSHAGRVPIRP